jgi:hypothetical protein
LPGTSPTIRACRTWKSTALGPCGSDRPRSGAA